MCSPLFPHWHSVGQVTHNIAQKKRWIPFQIEPFILDPAGLPAAVQRNWFYQQQKQQQQNHKYGSLPAYLLVFPFSMEVWK